jgi:Protein of unknown function (DUF559)
MAGRWRNDPDVSARFARERVARLAGRQQARITRAQLRQLGVGTSTIGDWKAAHYLHPRLPGVYAVGTTAHTDISALFEAVLYAGPGAMLSHATAVHWLGLIDHPPAQIHVSTPRRRASLAGVRVHGRRALERAVHRGIPVTTIAQSLLDLAAVSERRPVPVRVALARLDFRHEFDVGALEAACGAGCPGSRLLKWSIANHDPRFALTRSPLEDDWIVVCEQLDIPKPDAVNGHVHGIRCDNIYTDAKLIVELDGYDNHRSPAQVRRDHRNDRILRKHGWLVLRYGWQDVHDDAAAVAAEVLSELAQRTPRALRPATTDDGESVRNVRTDSP